MDKYPSPKLLDELHVQWINGNRKDVLGVLLSCSLNSAAVALACVSFSMLLSRKDRETFKVMLTNRAEE